LRVDTAVTTPVLVSLRERKKAATRWSLYESALRLAVERGLDSVTVEAIADEANVSRRTFSNYFANKEEALLYGDQVRAARLVGAVRDRPAGEGAWLALTEGACSEYADLATLDPKWIAQVRLVRRHPTVLARQAAVQASLEHDLAAAIVDRLPPSTVDTERTARIVAATFYATLRTVFIMWGEEQEPSSLSQSLSDALRAGLAIAGSAFA
jgi:AcrR family transcriptional regulator